ncbi:MAG: glutamine--fructose-6-phosphate transaminase (isomerizing) [Armatimonadota bacterium]|nr:glutamine--fructose-6-phosphate transaminase (isomerizing) [Armatimonadota bacterium]MDR5676113.1 glutamine--fructose-6-phosphate transaminase (isomerizing) [Armatimonadota bacterium]MDR5688540.1 glutamine--fructose-6-phosphate transaminase (isomerizing) [Armatimonadota bacterium]MDR7389021.1 glutamine--fructose-6-phosphate transaminase (isomerizing) [Armatimonadota bacterium]MDR7390647.1 glutamine--fructose-6-phosphate transaminase (isomerizing) [Armatimonadota bacterium]
MCGIMGYIGERAAIPVLLDGLSRLEYRGYDSAGVAVAHDGTVHVRKAAGKLSRLREILERDPVPGNVGIGHTRWATHGQPTDTNAHPHTDESGRFVVIHNGIIENFLPLREELASRGHRLSSDTDTELLAHLIEEEYRGDLVEATRRAVRRASGAYALVVLCAQEPHRIVAVRMISPLVVGFGQGEMLLASDIPALLPYTRDVLVVNDGELVVLTREGVQLESLEGGTVSRSRMHVTWTAEQAERGGFPHFMLKEIYEQPRALQETLMGRLDGDGPVVLEDVHLDAAFARALNKIWITGCGTAYHAGLVGRYLFERVLHLPTEADYAHELRYRDPLVRAGDLVVAISQSGETADTLAAARLCRSRGARVLAVTNVVGSTLSREADDVLYTRAGPEIAVASTKAYLTMLVGQVLLMLYLGSLRGNLRADRARQLVEELAVLPRKVQEILNHPAPVEALAREVADSEHVYFIGRGLDYAVAMEGSLKLKEISYVHSEAMPAGELKHGTLALVTPGTPVVVVLTQAHVYEKTVSGLQEVKARGARVVAVAYEDDPEIGKLADRVLRIPRTDDLLSPVLAAVPLQLLAYWVARERGHDIDQPRNLAKSVTVE